MSARIAWMSDIHLNFLDPEARFAFYERVRDVEADAVVIAGDIAEATSVERRLVELAHHAERPIWFVLGNHDYYRGSITEVRGAMTLLTEDSRWLRWLPRAGVVSLTSQTALLGHDGWSDGRYGDYAGSSVMINDYLLIDELAGLSAADRLDRLHALGAAAAAYVRTALEEALETHRHAVFVTHPPPFAEACQHHGLPSEPGWLPHFSCAAVGRVLLETMRARRDQRLVVLCGHTHSAGRFAILPNLTVISAGATYKYPELQPPIDVE